LEHMVFKGTATRSGPDIDRAFEELGADHNAATSVEYTYYWARVLGENLAPTVELLADMMYPRLDRAALDAERHVILEEIPGGAARGFPGAPPRDHAAPDPGLGAARPAQRRPRPLCRRRAVRRAGRPHGLAALLGRARAGPCSGRRGLGQRFRGRRHVAGLRQ